MIRKSVCILCSFILIVFASCTKQATSLLDAPESTYSDGEFAFVKWAGCRWAVIPQDEFSSQFRFEMMLLDAYESDFAKIKQTITDEYGEPYLTDQTMPKDMPPNLITNNVFRLANGRYPDARESLAFWETETPHMTIRLYTAKDEPGIGLPDFAVISIFDMDALKELCTRMDEDLQSDETQREEP